MPSKKPDLKEQLAKKVTMDLMKEYHGYRPDLSLNAPGLLMKFAQGMGGEENVSTVDSEYKKMMMKKLKKKKGVLYKSKKAKNAVEQAQGY